MSSHIIYKGGPEGPVSLTYRGGIGSVTKLLQLPEFGSWLDKGVVVADGLGVKAVKKYYDPDLQEFPHRRVAYDALMAGNDLLIFANYTLKNIFSESFVNTKDTVLYFREEYQRNPEFRERIDEAARKIIQLKMKIYPDLSYKDEVQFRSEVLVDEKLVLQRTGRPENAEAIREIAQEAITLLHPLSTDKLPSRPEFGDQILVATHNFPNDNPLLPVNKLEQLLIDLKQVDPQRIDSLPFFRTSAEVGLISFLNKAHSLTVAEEEYIGNLIDNADWIIFALLDQDWGPSREYNSDYGSYQEANTLKKFLDWNKYPEDAHLVVISFGVPPFTLDQTDISKIDAYYAVYSKIDPFPEVAVRAIFREVEPHTAAPIDIAGTDYKLGQQLEPDPKRSFDIQLVEPVETSFKQEDEVTLQTTQILDHNGNPVPDGIAISWEMIYSEWNISIKPMEAFPTVNGIAKASFSLDFPGKVTFQARGGPALSETLTLEVTSN